MGKKGNSAPAPVAPYSMAGEREPTADEIRLMQLQGTSLESATQIAQEQEARSKAMYDQWRASFLPVSTGMIDDNARRENGYTNGMSGSSPRHPDFE